MATSTRPRSATVAKRVLLGRTKGSHLLEHTLLPKLIALPVFSSDALSSNAYATEEIMVVLLAAGATSLGLVVPIATAIAILMAIVIASYRQTVREYPSGGGAYIVSRENLGTLPGLVAAAALLIDYVLTVSVSITAGVLAISSALPAAGEHSVIIAIGFLGLLTVANLRGVKEAGTIFAVPTYAFVASIFIMVVIGLVRCTTGCPAAEPIHAEYAATGAGTLSLFVILHAFSSGATALTGVEAISNGVPAFRRPQARNAAATLATMGGMAIAMFLGISWLATHIPGITVSHERSVVAQIAHAVFGGGIGFYAVQAFTAAILILAANTAYQDFPRLSAILARDGFMPSQFKVRGDRLVFSNGVIVLALMAGLLIYAFDADLSRLIQLYVVGVFTSFTLSQAGMVRHWRAKIREDGGARGHRRSIGFNAIGAVATGMVLVIITATKFLHGAWIVVAAIPFMVAGLAAIHRHYEHVRVSLRARHLAFESHAPNRFLLLVRDSGLATRKAIGYVRSLRAGEVQPIFIGRASEFPAVADGLNRLSPALAGLEQLPRSRRSVGVDLRQYIQRESREGWLTVVLPEEVKGASLWDLLTGQRWALGLKARLLFTPEVVVTDVSLLRGTDPGDEHHDLAGPRKHVVLVPVSDVNDGTVRAAGYARHLAAAHVEAIYFAVDPEPQIQVVADWWRSGIDFPLSLVEAPFRYLGPPLLEEVRRHTQEPGTVVTVVVPELRVTKWWEHALHGQTALYIKRLLLAEPGVVVTSIPYHVPSSSTER